MDVSVTKQSKRDSNFELLRIIAMFLICVFHYIFHGTQNPGIWHSGCHLQLIFTTIVLLSGKVGVQLFVFIGAYFLCAKTYASRRPLYLVFLSWLYSTGIFILLKMLRNNVVQGVSVKEAFFPVGIPSGYWFVSTYIVMLLLMPALNVIVNNVRQKRLAQLIILGVTASFFGGTFLTVYPKMDLPVGTLGTGSLVAFVIEYLTGAYVRKYGKYYSRTNIILFSIFLWGILGALFAYYTNAGGTAYAHLLIWVNNDMSPLVYIVAVDIFLLFTYVHISKLKIINYVSSLMFGVYLISDNTFIRNILWGSVNDARYHGIGLIEHCLITSIVVFIGCALIDAILRMIYRPIITTVSSKLGGFIDSYLR